MKQIKNLFVLLLTALAITACNSEDFDYDIEYTPIHPLGGQYTVTVSCNGTTVADGVMCTIANTIENDKDKCWIRIGTVSADQVYCINGKISCNVSTLSFSGSDVENLAGNVASSSDRFTLTDGTIALKGTTAPSGTVADKITFSYTTSRNQGAVYTVTGYRYTGWGED